MELIDEPRYCMLNLTEDEKIETVLHLLMRDFKDTDEILLQDQERICHEIITIQGPVAKFTDSCCFKDHRTDEQTCTTDIFNIWLKILYFLLACVRFGILFFGPLLFVPIVNSLRKNDIPYVVKQKEPLQKMIYLSNGKNVIKVKYTHLLNLRHKSGFNRLKLAASDVPFGQPTKVLINQYDILANYAKLLPENSAPIGFWSGICNAIFRCKIKDMGPFPQCCSANMFKSCRCCPPTPWFSFWKRVGRLLMVACIPIPYYIRLLVFYKFENTELMARKEAIARLGVEESYENSLMHYLTPTHPIFIIIYISYFTTAVAMAYMARKGEGGHFKRIIINAFRDLGSLKWINVLGSIISNIIWPFRRFGCMGCLVAIIYWPIAVPLTLAVYIFYCLPPIYLTIRMMKYARDVYKGKPEKLHRKSVYQIHRKCDETLSYFEIGRYMGYGEEQEEVEESKNLLQRQASTDVRTLSPIRVQPTSFRHFVEHVAMALLSIVSMYGILLILSECLGVLVEMLVFTMMGIIVNAGAVLKYVTLLFLVLIYSYDSFNNVSKKYLKLGGALFNEIKGRIKDQIVKVTSLPAELQENTGFKSVENNEQDDYEQPDDLSLDHPNHWFINDLVMFIDNEDMPRIPKQLFEDVCKINVAGAPGPVYASYLEATRQFLIILGFLGFVFLVVLSFGAIYKVSSTNQMLATLAGGFLPFLLRTFMAPARPNLEINTVSFRSKLDELIQNFYQTWAIYDFPFDLPQDEEEETKDGEDEENGDDADKKDDEEEKPSKSKSEAVIKYEAIIKARKERNKATESPQDTERVDFFLGDTLGPKHAEMIEMKDFNSNTGNGGVHFDIPSSEMPGEIDEVDIVIIMPETYCDDLDTYQMDDMDGMDITLDEFEAFQRTPEFERKSYTNMNAV